MVTDANTEVAVVVAVTVGIVMAVVIVVVVVVMRKHFPVLTDRLSRTPLELVNLVNVPCLMVQR